MRLTLVLPSILATIVLAAPPAAAQTGKETGKAYCLQQSGSGSTNCIYASMDACKKAQKQGSICIPNPAMTTGAGSGTMKDNMMRDKK